VNVKTGTEEASHGATAAEAKAVLADALRGLGLSGEQEAVLLGAMAGTRLAQSGLSAKEAQAAFLGAGELGWRAAWGGSRAE